MGQLWSQFQIKDWQSLRKRHVCTLQLTKRKLTALWFVWVLLALSQLIFSSAQQISKDLESFPVVLTKTLVTIRNQPISRSVSMEVKFLGQKWSECKIKWRTNLPGLDIALSFFYQNSSLVWQALNILRHKNLLHWPVKWYCSLRKNAKRGHWSYWSGALNF